MFVLWCQQDLTAGFWKHGWLPPPLSGPIPSFGFQACPFRTALLHSLSSGACEWYPRGGCSTAGFLHAATICCCWLQVGCPAPSSSAARRTPEEDPGSATQTEYCTAHRALRTAIRASLLGSERRARAASRTHCTWCVGFAAPGTRAVLHTSSDPGIAFVPTRIWAVPCCMCLMSVWLAGFLLPFVFPMDPYWSSTKFLWKLLGHYISIIATETQCHLHQVMTVPTGTCRSCIGKFHLPDATWCRKESVTPASSFFFNMFAQGSEK